MEFCLCLLPETVPCDHDDGLNPPVSKLEAAEALIFLLLDSSSKRFLLDMEEPDDLEKIESALINARLSFLFLSNLEENFTWAAAAASSSVVGSKRMPRPIFLEMAASSATLFFWLLIWARRALLRE